MASAWSHGHPKEAPNFCEGAISGLIETSSQPLPIIPWAFFGSLLEPLEPQSKNGQVNVGMGSSKPENRCGHLVFLDTRFDRSL